MAMAFITFRPITKVYPKDVKEVTGVVKSVVQSSGGDIHFQLAKDVHDYYINRASYLGLNAKQLKELLINKEVKLCHIVRWTPFTRDKVLPHISRLTYRDSIIFDEIIKTDGKK